MKCILGKRIEKNGVSLNTILNGGPYKITIVYSGYEKDLEIFNLVGNKISFDINLAISPLIEKEDRINCEAGILPSSLDNIAMTQEGFIRYTDRIFADFNIGVQRTELKIEKESVLRISTLESTGLNLGIKVYRNKELVASSTNIEGTEGILVELTPGTYVLEFSVENSIKEDGEFVFCETFLVNIGLSPLNAYTELAGKFFKCDDTSLIDVVMSEIPDKINSNGRIDIEPNTLYSIKNKVIKGNVLYSTKFNIPKFSYSYFEIFSEFLTGGLSIEILDYENTPVLVTSDRKFLQGTLEKGNYTFLIKTGPNTPGTSVKLNCLGFQLLVQIIATNDKKLSKWKCHGYLCQNLPSSLNTYDKLGPVGTLQSILPPARLFSKSFMAPDSSKDSYDLTNFTVQRPSILKVTTESQESPMKIKLLKNTSVIMETGSDQVRPQHLYSLSAELESGIIYTLEVFYYPQNLEKCHTYSLLLEIYMKPEVAGNCKIFPITNSFINYRRLDSKSFEFTDSNGLNPGGPSFSYYRGSGNFNIKFPLEISSQAIVSGDILSNNFGLTMEIYEKTKIKEWGGFESSNRYQLIPTVLNKGSYNVIIKDSFTSSKRECITSVINLLIEEESNDENSAIFMAKTKTCRNPSNPESLNIVGQLESGALHWHKKLNLEGPFTEIEFKLTKESIIRVFVKPIENVDIEITIIDNFSKQIHNTKVVKYVDGLHCAVLPGDYKLNIKHLQTIPIQDQCPEIEVDLEIIPEDDYLLLISEYDCQAAVSLSDVGVSSDISILYNPSNSDSSIPFVLESDSDVFIMIGYSNTISGYITMVLSDSNNDKIAESIGIENISQIKASLPKGTYEISVLNSRGTDTTARCWPLTITFETSDANRVCAAGKVPSKPTFKYGGPQNLDGSLSFYGEFQVEANPSILHFIAPKKSIARILTSSRSPNVLIKMSVYSDETLKKAIAYSTEHTDQSSIIFSLKENVKGYYLVLSYITQVIEPCMTFDLKFVIETGTIVSNLLECKVQSEKDFLPPGFIKLEKSKTEGGDKYAIFDKWMIGNKQDLPAGVTSSAKKNSEFVYEINIEVKIAGILSAEVIFDFLTNDLSLELMQNNEVIGRSKWESMNIEELSDMLNFASILEGIEINPGVYRLVITQDISANYLINLFNNVGICFPFAFEYEFISLPSKFTNTLILVEPSHLTHHNPSEALFIKLVFQKGLISVPNVYLQKTSGEKISPKETKLMSSSHKLLAKFTHMDLDQGACYELKAEGNFQSDGLSHSYCMISCFCNPKANAICNSDLTCLCPEPYSGSSCYECLIGFFAKDGQCIEIVSIQPEIKEIFLTPKNSVKKGQEVKLYVTFTSHPYDRYGVKINTIGGKSALTKAIFLKSGSTEIFSNNIIAAGLGGLKWEMNFNSEDFSAGKKYIVMFESNLLFDDNEKAFEYHGILPSIYLEVEAPKCLNGKMEKLKCICFKGYSGRTCDECAEGFERSPTQACIEIFIDTHSDFKIDASAYIVAWSPKGNQKVTLKMPISVTLTFSKELYSYKGLIINHLANTDYILNAFALRKTSSRKYIWPYAAKTSDGISWTIDFPSEEMSDRSSYKLIMIQDILFTKDHIAFSLPQEPLATFDNDPTLECSGHGIFKQKCECFEGYTGSKCRDCASGYMFVNGKCTYLDLDSDFSIMDVLLYALGYFIIGYLFYFFVNAIRRRKKNEKEGYEMVEKHPEDTGLFDDD